MFSVEFRKTVFCIRLLRVWKILIRWEHNSKKKFENFFYDPLRNDSLRNGSFLPFRSNLYSSKLVSINIVSLDESFSLRENINSTLASFVYFVIFYRWIRLFRNPDASEFIAIDIIFTKKKFGIECPQVQADCLTK